MIDVPIHQAVSVCTEVDVPIWIYTKKPVLRQTGRHAVATDHPASPIPDQDGRYSMRRRQSARGESETLIEFLERKGFGGDLDSEKFKDPASRKESEFNHLFNDALSRCIGGVWRRGDLEGSRRTCDIPGLPVRHARRESERRAMADARDLRRGANIPNWAETFHLCGAPTLAEECPWRTGPRAPLVGEHNEEVYRAELGLSARATRGAARKELSSRSLASAGHVHKHKRRKSVRPLEGVRILDLTWLLAGRRRSTSDDALGAEVIRLEWRDRLDFLRLHAVRRPNRIRAKPRGPTDPQANVNRGGIFNDINSGKRASAST